MKNSDRCFHLRAGFWALICFHCSVFSHSLGAIYIFQVLCPKSYFGSPFTVMQGHYIPWCSLVREFRRINSRRHKWTLINAANKLSENESHLAEFIFSKYNINILRDIYFSPITHQNLLNSSIFWAWGWIQDPTG